MAIFLALLTGTPFATVLGEINFNKTSKGENKNDSSKMDTYAQAHAGQQLAVAYFHFLAFK
jgi:hypothetical protein